MRKLLLSIGLMFGIFSANAQFGTAPDFTLTDLDGNTVNLYEILDAGIIAVVDVSATWCSPCWGLHQSHALQELHEMYGPDGTNQVRVMFYEGDASTTLEDLMGNTIQTQGDWLTGITYPVFNETTLSLDLDIWAPLGFPTVNVIRPSDKEIVADTYNLWSLEEQVSAINDNTGITLGVVGVEENNSFDALLSVYPNPVAQSARIDISSFNGAVNIELFDILGQRVDAFQANGSVADLNVSELANGNYIVKAFNNELSLSSKILVQK